jgi:hypothetical protein
MNDDVTDNIDKISLIADASYVDWMIRWICCMSRIVFKYL